MQARALKWGNSLAVRLPKALAAQLQVRENDPLELTVREGVLQLRPIKREWTLDVDDHEKARRSDHSHDRWGQFSGSKQAGGHRPPACPHSAACLRRFRLAAAASVASLAR